MPAVLRLIHLTIQAGIKAGMDGQVDQAQHGRVQRVVEVGDGLIAPVDGQRVLDQVIGADGQELQTPGEGAKAQGGGGDFDHASDLHGLELDLAFA